MQKISTYKDRALSTLSGQWGSAALVTFVCLFIYYGIYFAIALFTMHYFEVANTTIEYNYGWIATLLLLPMIWSYTVMFLDFKRKENLTVSKLFVGFNEFGRIFLTMLLQNIYIALWTCLFIIPGFVKAYSYAMTPYVLRDDPQIRYDAAISRSMKLMKGHKLQLFLLDLSFIGWVILSCCTLGIGFLFLLPYVNTAHAHFYEDLLKEEVQDTF
ncbi:MAG: DUF975 family protein [Prevotella sp.]|nr:DUF975 family protein [Prevotella sp.]MDY5257486.1 DUF975 family protein [Prevotella sp.]